MYSSNFTGIGRYTHELVDRIIRLAKKHEIVLFFNAPEFKKFKIPSKNVKKVLVNAKHYSFAEQTHFLKKLNQAKCSIVHFPHFNVPILYRKPYTVTIHDLTLSLFPGKKMTRFYHRLAYHFTIKNAVHRAKKVISVSNNTKEDIISHLKVDPSKIATVYNGVNSQFKQLSSQAGITKTLKKFKIKPPFLLYTGVWRSHKNLPRLIETFFILLNHKKLPLQLVITGKPNPHYPEVKQLVKNLKLSKHIHFPGLVTEKQLIQLYNAAQFYVFPSLYEGFGLPPLEAMRCGTPVLASETSSIPEICGDAAIYFDPLNPKDIARKITSLYKDTSRQVELIEKGSQRAQKFTWEKMAQDTYKIITEAAKHV